eukprot:480271_1
MSYFSTSICIVFISFFTLLFGQNQFCYNAYECVGTEWILSNQNIFGYGYKSLSGINTSITTGGDWVFCEGAFACSQISFIVSDDHIECKGSRSCANIGGSSYIKARFTSRINCVGANACQNSNITSYSEVGCYGDQSCINSNITSSAVYASGSYSLYGSTVYISNTLRLEGYQSGYGATIKCISGNTCNIYCFANGCQMTLICPENNNCNIILNNNDPTITIPP